MKHIYIPLFLFIVMFPLCVFCQRPVLTQNQKDTLKAHYFHSFDSLNSIYNCASGNRTTNRYVNPVALDTSFRTIFGTVILSNDDLVTNGTAVSITQDKDKSVLSFNYSTLKPDLKNAFNFGLYGTTSGSLFSFYSDKSWQKGGGINFGWSYLGLTNTRSYESNTCTKLIQKRNFFITSRLGQIYEAIEMETNPLETDSISLNTRLNFSNKTSAADIIPSTKSYKDDMDLYSDVVGKLSRYDSIARHATSIVYIDSVALADIVNFDKTNAEFTGYLVTWFSLNGNLGFAANKIYNDTLRTNDSLLNFYNKDFLRGKLTASINWSSYQKKYLWYANISCALSNTNFLENRKIADIPILRYDDKLKKIVIQDNQNQNLGTLDEYKNNIIAINPGAYYARFFWLKKIIGFEVNGNYTAYINKPKDVRMPNIFTTTFGVLLRVVGSKESLSKATIGLVAGLVNAEEKTKVWRNAFNVQLKVGVPFNVVFSKKDK